MSLIKLREEINKLANPRKAKVLSGFFKTGTGEYGEGDVFLGIIVPRQRELVKKFKDLVELSDADKLLESKFHEERLVALLILIERYEKNEKDRDDIFKLYIKNYDRINNWDLVDLTAPKIIGRHLIGKDRKILYAFAKSNNLWKKRIAIMATYRFVKNKDFKDTLKISEILLEDKHDLIHKAVGWMLREIGKRDLDVEEKFLKKHYKKMPRTMLRYAIEKFQENKRKAYLRGEI